MVKTSTGRCGIVVAGPCQPNKPTTLNMAVYSNTFADDKLGVAFAVSHQERDFQKQSANIQGWQANVALPTLAADTVIDARPTNAQGNADDKLEPTAQDPLMVWPTLLHWDAVQLSIIQR